MKIIKSYKRAVVRRPSYVVRRPSSSSVVCHPSSVIVARRSSSVIVVRRRHRRPSSVVVVRPSSKARVGQMLLNHDMSDIVTPRIENERAPQQNSSAVWPSTIYKKENRNKKRILIINNAIEIGIQRCFFLIIYFLFCINFGTFLFFVKLIMYCRVFSVFWAIQ